MIILLGKKDVHFILSQHEEFEHIGGANRKIGKIGRMLLPAGILQRKGGRGHFGMDAATVKMNLVLGFSLCRFRQPLLHRHGRRQRQQGKN